MAKIYVTMSVNAIIDTDLENVNDVLDYLDVSVTSDDESVALVLDAEVEDINVTDSK